MTRADFTAWLAAMKAAGLARSDKRCAELLGVSVTTIVNWKQGKAPISHTVALACRALYHNLPPWP